MSAEYDSALQRHYHAMVARLRADGYTTIPTFPIGTGDCRGLTVDDAEVEIAELERLIRKRFPQDGGRG